MIFLAPMEKGVILTYIIGVLVIVNVFFMLIGPFVWINSSLHFSELTEFEENGVKTVGTIGFKGEPRRGITQNHSKDHYFVAVDFVNESNQVVFIPEVKVKYPLWKKLKIFKEVELLYQQDEKGEYEAILIESYDLENIGWSYHPIYGKWMTLISWGMFLVGVGIIVRFWLRNGKVRKSKRYVRRN